MTRRIYEPTPGDCKRAIEKAAERETLLATIEAHRHEPQWFKRRQTTYGLAKRNATRLLNAGDIEYYRGRGQGIIDVMSGLEYAADAREGSTNTSPAYRQGYYDGWHHSPTAMRDYIANNLNFAGLGGTK